jgi:hypothetical protein
MEDETPRSRPARVAAETALVRVVHHYGSRPEFVLMGGLMPEYLCAGSGEILQFKECDTLGAVNLRGTGFAPRDVVTRRLTARGGDLKRTVEISVTGLAGFLMAKSAAARERRKPKDWYDIAFVLLHNDAGGPEEAAKAILARFPGELVGGTRTALDDLAANFMDTGSQGSQAYADQMRVDYPDLDLAATIADAVVAVKTFHRLLSER